MLNMGNAGFGCVDVYGAALSRSAEDYRIVAWREAAGCSSATCAVPGCAV